MRFLFLEVSLYLFNNEGVFDTGNDFHACGALADEALSDHCRKNGIYPHQVNQWKLDFASGKTQETKTVSRAEMKALKQENKFLKKI
jgi:hypothetical protein